MKNNQNTQETGKNLLSKIFRKTIYPKRILTILFINFILFYNFNVSFGQCECDENGNDNIITTAFVTVRGMDMSMDCMPGQHEFDFTGGQGNNTMRCISNINQFKDLYYDCRIKWEIKGSGGDCGTSRHSAPIQSATRGIFNSYLDDHNGRKALITYHVKPFKPESITHNPYVLGGRNIELTIKSHPEENQVDQLKWECMFSTNQNGPWTPKGTYTSNKFSISVPNVDKNGWVKVRAINKTSTAHEDIKSSCWQTSSFTIIKDPEITVTEVQPDCSYSDAFLKINMASPYTGSKIKLYIDDKEVAEYSLKNKIMHNLGRMSGKHTYNIRMVVNGNQPYAYFDELQPLPTFTINRPTGIYIGNPSITKVKCIGGSDGSVTVSASGGTGNLQYAVDNFNYTSNRTFGGLSQGEHTIHVKDARGCHASKKFTMGVSQNFSVNVTAKNEQCVGTKDGSIQIHVSGNNAPFQYSKNGGASYSSENPFQNLVANTYNIWVKDNNGCKKQYGNVTISKADTLKINNVSHTHVTVCAENKNASITINAEGGAGGYTYILNDTGEYKTPSITALDTGTYAVKIRDINGCEESWPELIKITAPPPVIIDDVDTTNVTACYGDASGIIQIHAHGGTGNLSYSVKNFFEPGRSVFDDCVQDYPYIIKVKDENECTKTWTDTIKLSGPMEVLVDSVKTDSVTICSYNTDGEIQIFASGGTGTYTYSILGNADENYQASNHFVNLTTGAYQVSVKDNKNCKSNYNDRVHVYGPDAIQINPFEIDTISCYGDSTGIIQLSAYGGTSSDGKLWYSFNGEPYEKGSQLYKTKLPSGNYTISIKDDNNCIKDTTLTIPQYPQIKINSLKITNVKCNRAADGIIEIHATGGKKNLFYKLNDGEFLPGNIITNLDTGIYVVTLMDVNNCIYIHKNEPVTITEPTKIELIDTLYTPPTCTSKGDVEISIQGGTPFSYGYQYILTNKSTMPERTQIIKNTTAHFNDTIEYENHVYTIEAVDSNGCSLKNGDDWVITVDAGIPITVTDKTITHPTCYGGSDGSIEIKEITGGSGTYVKYQWSKNNLNPLSETDTLAENLDEAVYFLTITDSEGCTSKNEFYEIINPPRMEVFTTITNALCFGSSDGIIKIDSIKQGTSDFNYQWTDSTGQGSTSTDTSMQNTLSAGLYKIKITDAKNCSIQEIFEVGQATEIKANIQAKNNYNGYHVRCYGITDTALVTVEGGTPDYKYLWDNGDTTHYTGGLTAGEEHQVIIYDTHKCYTKASIILSQPGKLAPSITPDEWYEGEYNVKCYGDSGSATITCAGGIPPYQYQWQNGETTTQGHDILAGTEYSVTIKDGNNCYDTAYINLQPPEILKAIALPDNIYNGYNVNCYDSEGSATATATGGVRPYAYEWSTSDTTATVILPSETEFMVTVTDKYYCTDTTKITLDAPNSFLVEVLADNSFNGYNIKCYGGLGTATAYGTDGVKPYTYLWSNGQTTAQATNLVANSLYSVTITDANNCTAIGRITLTQPDSVYIAEQTITHIACKGENSGAIDITPLGGTGIYSYLWETTNGTGLDIHAQDQLKISKGTYTIHLSDNNSCSYAKTYSIDEPLQALALTINNKTNVRCFGEFNGTIELQASQGWGDYSYSKDTVFQSSNTFNTLKAGNYTMKVKDKRGCTINLPVEISEPNELTANIKVNNNALCYQSNTGSITITPQGGTPNYTYSINNGTTTQNNNTFNLLAEGQYPVLVIDKNNCTTTGQIEITAPGQIQLSITDITNATCGNADGQVVVSASSGTPPYTYQWLNQGQTGDTLKNVSAGTYQVLVKDKNLCERTFDILVQNNKKPGVEITNISNATCYNSADGSASILITNAIEPFQIQWSDPLNQTGTTATGLTTGNYTITVTDAESCQTITPVNIGPENEITIQTTATNISCKGSSNGEATALASNGTAPYTYIWKNSSGSEIGTGSHITNLSAGQYTVEVWDANNCPNGSSSPGITAEVSITEPFNPLNIEIIEQINPSCFGQENGQVQVNATGGEAPYQFSGNNSDFSDNTTFKNLSHGEKTFYVKDNKECIASITTIIEQPQQISFSCSDIISSSCNSGSDASFTVTASGGTAPYQYKIDNGTFANNNSFWETTAGEHTIYIKDDNLCEHSETFEIKQPQTLTASVTKNLNTVCGNKNGSVTIAATGGTKPYSYLWNDNRMQTDSVLLAVDKGTYTVTITDNQNCTFSMDVKIEETPAPAITTNIINSISCTGMVDGSATIQISEGTAPYAVQWNDPLSQTGLTANKLAPGGYWVTVTDLFSCKSVHKVTIPDVNPLNLSLVSSSNPTCSGSKGSINVSATGGTQPYSYTWDNGQTGSQANNLMGGTYQVTLTDKNNCTTTGSYQIYNPPGVIVSLPQSSAKLCKGQSITLDAGHPGKSHSWSSENGFSSTEQIVELNQAGTYRLAVTNSQGCVGLATFELILSDHFLDAGIMLADEGYVGDTLVICELTWPIPDSIAWDIPKEFSIIGKNRDHLFLMPQQTGEYTIGANIFSDVCFEYIEKNVSILSSGNKKLKSLWAESANQEGYEMLLKVFPNPTEGEFALAVKLEKENDITTSIYNITGAPVSIKKEKGKSEYLIYYNIANLRSGCYMLIVRSGDYIKTTRFIKL